MEHMKRFAIVNCFVFFWFYLFTWSFRRTVEKLVIRYNAVNITINFFITKVHIINSAPDAKRIMSQPLKLQHTYLNEAFFESHGFFKGIGNINTDAGLWNLLHDTLRESIKENTITQLVHKHSHILLGDKGFEFEAVSTVAKFTTRIWSEFCFGETVDRNLYKSTRTQIITLLKKNFYDSRWKCVPGISIILAKIRRHFSSNEIQSIIVNLDRLIDNAHDTSFVGRFKHNCNETMGNYDTKTIIRDNVFLAFLAYDFWNVFLLNTFMSFVMYPAKGADRLTAETYNGILGQGFLFPLRMRKTLEEFIIDREHTVHKDDFVVIDMVKARMPFGYGVRRCVGETITWHLYKEFTGLFVPFKVVLCDPLNPLVMHSDENTPFVLSKHLVRLTLEENYFAINIPFHDFKGVKFYDLSWIVQVPFIHRYVNFKMTEIVRQYHREKRIDMILVPEARGFLFAGSISSSLGIPLAMIRKQNKIPGKVDSIRYLKAYDQEETLEISSALDLEGKNCAIIDDGIASGATLYAIEKLLRIKGASISLVAVVVKHGYVECKYSGKVEYLFYL